MSAHRFVSENLPQRINADEEVAVDGRSDESRDDRAPSEIQNAERGENRLNADQDQKRFHLPRTSLKNSENSHR